MFSFECLYVLRCYLCFFDCKCKSLKRLGENRKQTETNRKTTEQLEGKQKTNRNTGYPAHEPPRKINISKGLAGRFLLFFVLFVVFLRVDSVVFCFYMCLFDCKCKCLKRLGENIKTQKQQKHKET